MANADRPHAIIIPKNWAPPAHVAGGSRRDQIFNYAEEVLGVDQVWIRDLGDGTRKFITDDPNDSLLFPDGHPKGKTPRYRWVKMPDGAELGFLKPEAQAEIDLANESPDERKAREAATEEQRKAYSQRVVRSRRWLDLKDLSDRTPDEESEFKALDTALRAEAAL